MTSVLLQPTFAVQLELFPHEDGMVTLVCDVCHGHTMVARDWAQRLVPDCIGCYECGAVNALPDKEML